nr:VanZ family protein [Actibacterium sp. 188UL27-1]
MRGGIWRFWPLALTTLFVMALALHPLPRPGYTCKSAVLIPFDYDGTLVLLWATAQGPMDWITSTLAASTAMNVGFFALVGAALTRHTTYLWHALAYGLALSLIIELSQVTGLWGVYPCPYRTFDITDLILNPLGVVLGFALWPKR